MIKFEDVTMSYTGKRGCMCGCRGTYRVASHFGVEAANKQAGYEAHTETNDRAVKLAVNKLNKSIDWSDPKVVEEHVNGGYAYFDTDTRTCVVYFTNEAKGRVAKRALAVANNETKTVKSLMTGKDVEIAVDAPRSCDPSSELYWSM